jgi:WD40 repeat protein
LAAPGNGVECISFDIAISRDGRTVITGGADDRVRFWDALGREVQKPIIANQEQVTAVGISSDSVHIATGGRNGTVKLWERAGKMREELVGHRGAVLGVEFSREGKLLPQPDRMAPSASRYSTRASK